MYKRQIGYFASIKSGLTNSTAIGNDARVTANNTIQLGNTAVTDVKTSGALTTGAAGTAVTYPIVHGTNGQVLSTTGSGTLTWITPVSTFSGGSTGLTPSTATSGAVTLAGTLAAANGGTGLTSFTSGGAIYASSTSALASGTLPVASGGTGLTSFANGGAIYATGFTTLASGTLPIASGGTSQSTYAKGDILYASAANTLSKLTIGTDGQVLIANNSGIPYWGSNGLSTLNGQTATSHLFSTPTNNTLVDIGWTSTASGNPSVATHSLNIPDATTGKRGVINIGSQTFAGDKTFSNDISANGVYIGRGYNSVTTNLAIGSNSNDKNFNVNTSSVNSNNNIAIGIGPLASLRNGYHNNAVGTGALTNTNDGYNNNAFGYDALRANTSGYFNTAIGEAALSQLSTGNSNTAVGNNSLISTTGSQNTAIGSTSNVAAGKSNSTAIGYGAVVSADNTIQLGNASVSSVVTSGTLSATGAVLGTLSLTTALPAASGGTGQSSYTTGDLLYASTSTALSKLPDVAVGSALISGNVGVAPSWGKIGLTTHVSGTLPIANGGTNLTTYTTGDLLYASSANTLNKLTVGSNGQVLTVSAGSPSWQSSSLPTHYVGESYGGGIVFYVYDNGLHGLIGATADQAGLVTWSANGTSGNYKADGIGAGAANTKLMINALGYSSAGAGRYCVDYYASQSVGGAYVFYTDWYLPSKTEISLLWQNRSYFTGFYSGDYYWTSQESEASSGYAWSIRWSDGLLSNSGVKTSSLIRVRAIRQF